MSYYQQNFDSCTNSNQPLWGNGIGHTVARANADVLAHAALIICARAKLEEAIAAAATPVRPFLIKFARYRLPERMATT